MIDKLMINNTTYRQARRPLKSRQTQWAKATASWLFRKGIHPNCVSIASIIFAMLAGIFIFEAQTVSNVSFKIVSYLLTAFFIQLRLLCNLMDGMLAVEGGLKSKEGELFNELPDRIADVIILVCAGYAISQKELGWLSALFAIFTAYIRVVGTSIGTHAYFHGPMAKPHRMFLLTMGCLCASILAGIHKDKEMILLSLIFIALGSLITCLRRIIFIARELRNA